MKYLLLIYMEPDAMTEAEREHCYVESTQLANDLHASGQYLGANPLHPTSTATRPPPTGPARGRIGLLLSSSAAPPAGATASSTTRPMACLQPCRGRGGASRTASSPGR